MADSLFNVGGQLITAGREVVFVATSGSTTPLGQNGNWRFMMENGPTQMYPAYLHSLNLMVRTIIPANNRDGWDQLIVLCKAVVPPATGTRALPCAC